MIAAAAAILGACNPAPEAQGNRPVFDGPGPEAVEVYSGQLVELDGARFEESSMLTIRLYTYEGSGEAPTRYWIGSDCQDAGYLDADRQMFLSGHAPVGTDAEKMVAAELSDPERRCPAADPGRYVQLMELMYEGAALEMDGTQAVFTSPTGKSARFLTTFRTAAIAP